MLGAGALEPLALGVLDPLEFEVPEPLAPGVLESLGSDPPDPLGLGALDPLGPVLLEPLESGMPDPFDSAPLEDELAGPCEAHPARTASINANARAVKIRLAIGMCIISATFLAGRVFCPLKHMASDGGLSCCAR